MTACIPSITKTCRDNDRTRSDKEVLEKLVVTDMVLQESRILNREGIRSIPAPDRPTSAPDIFTPTSSRTDVDPRGPEVVRKVLPCDREHGPYTEATRGLSLDVWRICSLFTTDASGTLRDGAFVVSMPRTMWIRPTLAGVMEEALLLNLHPVMHYVLNRRNGL
jgi:hypothetical protein